MFAGLYRFDWRWLAAAGREPDEIGKLTLGCLIMGAFTTCDAL
jgi:hypothetical protein